MLKVLSVTSIITVIYLSVSPKEEELEVWGRQEITKEEELDEEERRKTGKQRKWG